MAAGCLYANGRSEATDGAPFRRDGEAEFARPTPHGPGAEALNPTTRVSAGGGVIGELQEHPYDIIVVVMIRVTFDSNSLDRAVRPERFPKDPHHGAYLKVRDALAAGRIKGYFSESLITLEGIENKHRVDVIGSTRLAMQGLRPYTADDGREIIEIPMRMEQARHELHPEHRARILAAATLKVHALRGPSRVGWIRVDDPDRTIFESHDYDDALLRALELTTEVASAVQARGVGDALLFKIAAEFATRDNVTEPWPQSLPRAQNDAERRQVQRAVAEWADGDAVSSHIGFGIDLFCSEDMGKSTGGFASILDPTNRAWLASTYGVRFVTLPELASMV